MISLEGRSVFLSASFPSGERGEEVRPYDPAAIADAVTAVVRAVLLSNGRLAFGGHPTITPLVLMIGTELGIEHAVDVFQSEWFADEITDETMRLVESGVGEIHWTRSLHSLEESLVEMRSTMLESSPFVGAVFIGGMSGIWREYDQVGQVLPNVPRIPIAGPGGAAARVATEFSSSLQEIDAYFTSRHYPFVASQIVELFVRGIQS